MFSFIIKALGGFTSEEFESVHISLESWRARCTAAETTVELVKEIMTRERERAERLEHRLEDRLMPNLQQQAPNLDPVGDRRLSSWPRIRRELERQNRINAKVSREKVEETIRSEE